MNWFATIAIAVPILFVIGMVYNAIKDQKKLEQGVLKKVLKERELSGQPPRPYDDEEERDDYGLKPRQDLYRQAAAAGTTGSAASSVKASSQGKATAAGPVVLSEASSSQSGSKVATSPVSHHTATVSPTTASIATAAASAVSGTKFASGAVSGTKVASGAVSEGEEGTPVTARVTTIKVEADNALIAAVTSSSNTTVQEKAFKPLGNHEATDAASYFSNYYK